MDSFVIVVAHGVGILPDHDQLMLLMSLLPILFIGIVLIANALDRRHVFGQQSRTVGLSVPLTAIAAGLSLGAAAIHFSVIREHLEEFALFGYAFIGLAWFQAIWALVYVLRGNARMALGGAAVNAGAVTVWLISRTFGLPFGSEAGVPEAVGFADLLATAFEVALIAVLAATLWPAWARRLARREMPIQRAFVLAVFCVATMVLLTVVAMAGTATHVAARL